MKKPNSFPYKGSDNSIFFWAFFLVCMAIGILIWLAIGFVAVHFITKWW